ncbi:MAG: CDP-alcohol phosphatidyltransferase family protein [Patescibacteria group bacterium]|nr:CDP-alcohol phosphatidyltransferase family protein [Patescibacteria group bacterium]
MNSPIHPIEKIKEKSKEKKEDIRRIVVRRKDDMLTALEKNWRDWALRPLTALLWKMRIRANHITIAGFFFIALAIWMYAAGYPFSYQFALLAAIAVSDAVDGPQARNNDDVTVLGTWMDHLRDASLMVWASYLIYVYHLLSGELIIIIWVLELLLMWASVKGFLIRYLETLSRPEGERQELMEQFSLDNLQASVIGRLEFFCWTSGYGFLFLSLFFPSAGLVMVGQALIILEIIFSALNIADAYQRPLSAPPSANW